MWWSEESQGLNCWYSCICWYSPPAFGNHRLWGSQSLGFMLPSHAPTSCTSLSSQPHYRWASLFSSCNSRNGGCLTASSLPESPTIVYLTGHPHWRLLKPFTFKQWLLDLRDHSSYRTFPSTSQRLSSLLVANPALSSSPRQPLICFLSINLPFLDISCK